MSESENKTPSQPNPLDELWKTLKNSDLREISSRSGASLNRKTLSIAALGQTFTIVPKEESVSTESGAPAGFLVILLLLQYLLNSQDIPLTGTLSNPMEFAGGDFFFRGPHTLDTSKLEVRFGEDKEGFLKAGLAMGGTRQDSGDVSFSVQALPKVPVTYSLWCADEEFPAEVKILFDASAEKHLPLDMIWALVNLTNKQLLQQS